MYLRLKERKTKNLQDLKISGDSADSLCTANPRNRRKVAFVTCLEKIF